MEQETRTKTITTTLTKSTIAITITTGSMLHVGNSQASAPFCEQQKAATTAASSSNRALVMADGKGGIHYSFVKNGQVVWQGVSDGDDWDTFCDNIADQVPVNLNYHFEDDYPWVMYVNNRLAADCETALLYNHDVIEFRFEPSETDN